MNNKIQVTNNYTIRTYESALSNNVDKGPYKLNPL